MNRRISPDDLNTSPHKELIQLLVLEWIHAKRLAEGITYEDYVTDIRILLLTTQNSDRTRAIVQAVLDQARALDKTSAWVEQELKFEGMIHGADRADFLRLDLSQASKVDNTALDLYNERISRFLHHD